MLRLYRCGRSPLGIAIQDPLLYRQPQSDLPFDSCDSSLVLTEVCSCVWHRVFCGGFGRRHFRDLWRDTKGKETRFQAGTLAMTASGDVAGGSEGVKLSVKIRI